MHNFPKESRRTSGDAVASVKAPKIFAARIGFLCALVIALLVLIASMAAVAVAVTLGFFNVLDAVLDFCVGCFGGDGIVPESGHRPPPHHAGGRSSFEPLWRGVEALITGTYVQADYAHQDGTSRHLGASSCISMHFGSA